MLNRWHIDLAVRALSEGGLVLHAAEGVWGLACDPFNAQAVSGLLALKGRPVAKGLILIGSSAEDFSPELKALPAAAEDRVRSSWPDALTWVLPNRQFPYWITGANEGVAVRVPGHPQARALAAAFGGPLVSTSANPSGMPAPVDALVARRRLLERGFPGPEDYILPGKVLTPGAASRIQTPDGVVLRAG